MAEIAPARTFVLERDLELLRQSGWIKGGRIESAIVVGKDRILNEETLRYPDDVLVNLHVSWLNPRKARDITVVGEKRMLTFDDMNLTEPIRVYDKRVTDDRTTVGYVDSFASFRASIREGEIVIPRVVLGEPLRAECEHFLDCVESGTAPLCGGVQGVAVVRVLEAIERSVRSGGREERTAP